MAPVIPIIAGVAKAVAAVAAVGGTIYSTVQSARQANAAAKRQEDYYNKIAQQEAATAAEQKRIDKESQDRARAYGASLLSDNTQMNNMLSGGWEDDDYSTTILNSGVQSGSVSSMFA